jgi:hypothetical protein
MPEKILEVSELYRASISAFGVSREDIGSDSRTVIPRGAAVRSWKKESVEYEKTTREFLL